MEELGEQLILIEPFNREWVAGFNPLESADGNFPAMLELAEIFRKFWGDGYWGPRMDEVLRNTLLTLSENNLTLMEARPLLTLENFRQRLTENVTYSEVKDYWTCRYNPLSDRMQALYREPVLNKFSAFLADPMVYRIIGQRQSTFHFRWAMDQGKWIMLNLSKGQLKENIRLLGGLFLGKIWQAALSRADVPENERSPFYLFVDEFQSFTHENLENILSESRKFHLGLTIAHQNLDQLSRELRAAILGNVGTEVFFRLSHHDASQISSEMDQKERHIIEKRLIDLRPREAYLKIKGEKPRLLKTSYVEPAEASREALERIRRASFKRWARPVAQIEREIEERRHLWRRDLVPAPRPKRIKSNTFERL
jgi:hypothetical protein